MERKNETTAVNAGYCNLPMKLAFENRELTADVRNILTACYGAEQGICEFERWRRSGRTFRQFAAFSSEEELPPNVRGQVFAAMEAADARAPFPITALYPWLEETRWSFDVARVIGIRVDVRRGAERLFDLARMEFEETPQSADSSRDLFISCDPVTSCGSVIGRAPITSCAPVAGRMRLSLIPLGENEDTVTLFPRDKNELYKIAKSVLFDGTLDLDDFEADII